MGLLLGSILLALNVGKYPLSPSQLWETISCSFSGQCEGNTEQTVLWQIRLPRILPLVLSGLRLLVRVQLIKVCLKIRLFRQIFWVFQRAQVLGQVWQFLQFANDLYPIFAFSGGILAVLCVSLIASRSRTQDPILVLVLSGIAIGSLLGAGISLLKILADPFTQLPSITFWLLGSLTAINQQDLIQLIPMLLLGIIPIFYCVGG